jgi:RNA polymerase sigma-70 factor (ECF subfamily)
LADIDHWLSSSNERRARFEAIAAEIFEPLQRYIRRRIEPNDAEDVFADVLLTVWRRLDDAPEGQILPWSYGVARRTLANRRRARSRHLRLLRRLELESHDRFVPPLTESGLDPELAEALGSLSPDDREVLRLWAWEQLEPREIGPVLGISVNAATLRLSRARTRLGRLLSGQDRGLAGHEPLEGTQESR